MNKLHTFIIVLLTFCNMFINFNIFSVLAFTFSLCITFNQRMLIVYFINLINLHIIIYSYKYIKMEYYIASLVLLFVLFSNPIF